MYEFPGEGRKAGVHVPPWNPLEGRPCHLCFNNNTSCIILEGRIPHTDFVNPIEEAEEI